ncbi:hypothetical protein M9H77_16679 [Catharanthus roseus]|uniref:Uncharacterized protein n=1 Tax=Catharanthus roseus TaxID=4058 RepID=A0ACC0B2F0_CATRO|nr:hypothetical protein M9H77_16679 [Catharanthus roseus]
MPLLECVGMTPTREDFTVATAFMCNEQATIYRWGLDLSSVAFWGRDNEQGRELTFRVEAVAINILKEKYDAKSNPIVKNLSNKISHLDLKKIMDELKKACQMVEEPEKIGYDIPEEHDRDMKSEMRDLTSLLQENSTGPISNVREVRQLIKGSESGSGSGSGSNPSLRGRGRPPRSGRGRCRGRSSGRSSLSSVVSPDSLPVPLSFNNAFLGFMYQFIQTGRMWLEMVIVDLRRMNYDLRHRMNVYEQLFGSVERVTELIMKKNWEVGLVPPEYWMDTPDHLYVIANTFNLCVLVDGCPLPPLKVQWDYHRDIRISG